MADATQAALMTEPADLFLFLHSFGADEVRLAADLDTLERLLDLSRAYPPGPPERVGHRREFR